MMLEPLKEKDMVLLIKFGRLDAVIVEFIENYTFTNTEVHKDLLKEAVDARFPELVQKKGFLWNPREVQNII